MPAGQRRSRLALALRAGPQSGPQGKRFAALRGSGGQHGQLSTDALMQLLRGYDGDVDDPGLAMPPAGPKSHKA